MASATLAGVNPVYGLYNLMVGTPVAALFTSSVYMAVINTSAMALVVLEALVGFSGDDQLRALVTLTLLVGAFQLILALLKLGYLIRTQIDLIFDPDFPLHRLNELSQGMVCRGLERHPAHPRLTGRWAAPGRHNSHHTHQ